MQYERQEGQRTVSDDVPEYVLQAHEMGGVMKSLYFWWLTPKRWVLRRFEARGGAFQFEMWNGKEYRVAVDVLQARQSMLSRIGNTLSFVRDT